MKKDDVGSPTVAREEIAALVALLGEAEERLQGLTADQNEEIFALVEVLVTAEERVEALTGGEVDTVTARDGRTFLLRRAQDQLRHNEAVRQAAILNALPAHVALLDAQGCIVSVNAAWQRFGNENGLHGPADAIGLSYIDVCEAAQGQGSSEARPVADGIRAVLRGEARGFSLEYPCHSPIQQRWFLLTVTPLAQERAGGAVVMHLDITERKRSEEDQRAMRQLLDNIVENIPTAVHLKSVQDNFRIRLWNKAAESMYGLSRGGAIGRTVHELWPRADADRMQAADLDLVAQGGMQDFPDRLVPTLGRGTIHAHMRKVVLRDPAGNATHVLVTADDITAHRAEQARLNESERRKSAILESSLDSLIIIDHQGSIVEFNTAAESSFGVPRARALGQSMADLIIPARLREAHHRGMAHYLATGEGRILGQRLELSAMRADGAEFPIELSITPIGSGPAQMFAGSIRDISERVKRTEDQTRFVAAMDATQDAIYLVDRSSMQFVHINDAACSMQGRPREEILAMGPAKVLSVSDEDLGHIYDALISSGVPAKPLEIERQRKDGTQVCVELRRQAQKSGDRWIIITLVRDVTERRRAADRITYLNRMYAVLSGINALIVHARDRAELLDKACRIAVEQGGFLMAWIGVLDARETTLVPEASAQVDAPILQVIKDYFSNRESLRKGGSLTARAIREKKVLVSNDTLADPEVALGAAYAARGVRSLAILPLMVADRAVGVLVLYAAEAQFFREEELTLLSDLAHDIAFGMDHISKTERLAYLAYYDVLTGLANRSLFLDRVAQHLRSAQRSGGQMALFLVDLEGFKSINDSLGQAGGDKLLRQVAQWLVRKAGDAALVARVDADHFSLVLPAVRQDGELRQLLEQTLAAFEAHMFRVGDAVFRIAVKAGVAIFPADGGDADMLFRNAEAALKRAKQTGERYLFYEHQMSTRVADRLSLENQLRQALDNREFVLHYQPKIKLTNGALTGAEALIRWNHPRKGLVPPGHFIDLLEETGLIREVGRWAIQTALNDYQRWRATGLAPVRIAVNVSPRQLRHRDFVAELAADIGTDGMDALELEITESLIVEDASHSSASLQAIRAMGLRIAIDDFGTGFSSLSYLARLPVDALKIDHSFIHGMAASARGLALVSTIVDLAHAMDLVAVAEGVETEEQSRLLRLLNCDEVQGFLFSKALPVDVFEARYLTTPNGGPDVRRT